MERTLACRYTSSCTAACEAKFSMSVTLARCPMWVREWLRRYDEGGLEGLLVLPRCGRSRRTSRTVEYGLISSRAMDRIPLPSLYMQQAARMSLALPGETVLSCGKHSPCLRQEEIHLHLEALPRCGPARVKVSCGRRTCARIKIFRFDANIQKIQITSERIFLASTMHILSNSNLGLWTCVFVPSP